MPAEICISQTIVIEDCLSLTSGKSGSHATVVCATWKDELYEIYVCHKKIVCPM